MKTFISKFCFLLLVLSITTTSESFAQNFLKSPQETESELKSDLDYLFQYLDKTKITSGLLSNYALELTEMKPYNGVLSDSNAVNLQTWLNLYKSVYSAKINNQITLTAPETVENQVKSASIVNNAVPLSILHYEYDMFDEGAVNKGYLSYYNGRLYDISGKPSPYLKNNLFAVAPQKEIFATNTVAFVFKSDLFFRNTTKSVSGLYICFDDVSGWQSASWNTIKSYTFDSGGYKTIKFKIVYSDGSAFYSQTNVYVKETPAILRSNNGAPYTHHRETIQPNGLHSGGTMEIHFHDPSLGLRKPLIIAEPFDMSATLAVATAYNLDYVISQVPEIQQFLDIMQYDVIYVNYNHGLDDIVRNAELFKEAIRRVNYMKTVNYPNAVIGVSMGGLVARYALRSMELNNEYHDTWKYISLDAPHKGANLPLGLQAMVRHIESLVKEYGTISDVVDQVFEVLNSPATKQMLIYYCGQDGNVDNSGHKAFQAYYDAIGFPKKCQNIAVSNGDLLGSTIFDPYSEIFRYQPTISDVIKLADLNEGQRFVATCVASLLYIFNMFTLGNCTFHINFSVHALPNLAVSNIYNGYAYMKKEFLFGLFSQKYYFTQKDLNSEAYMFPLDGAAGSFNKFDLGNSTNDATVDSLLMNFRKNKFTFIPTHSALSNPYWYIMLNANFSVFDLYAMGFTEFNDYMVTPANKQHPDFAHSATFLAQHLASPPLAFDLQSSAFNTMVNVPLQNRLNLPVIWSVSNNKMILTNQTNSSVTVYCNDPNTTGILTATANVPVNPAVASILGLPSGANYMPVSIRKRLVAKDTTLIVTGDFSNNLATLKIEDYVIGVPVSWNLSDKSNFRIVSSSHDSVVIEALSYSKNLTVSATVGFAGKQISTHKSLSSPPFTFDKPSTINCQESTLTIPTVLSSIQSVEWSSSNNDGAFEFVGSTNQPTVVIRGLQPDRNSVNITAKVTLTNGEVFTSSQTINVKIPQTLNMYVCKVWKDETPKRMLLYVEHSPFNDTGASYLWMASDGVRIIYVDDSYSHVDNFELSDYEAIFESDDNNVAYNLLSDDLQTKLRENLLTTNFAEIVSDDAALRSDSESSDSLVITKASSVTNIASGTVEAVTLNVALNDNSSYVVLENPTNTTYTPMDPPTQLDDLCGYAYLVNPPNYLMLTYPGGNITISCTFRSPCNNLTARIFIPGINFTCTYASGTRTIEVAATIAENSNATTIDLWSGDRYTINVYNDLGIVKTSYIYANSNSNVLISMNEQSNGYYYVNVLDKYGNAIIRKTIYVY